MENVCFFAISLRFLQLYKKKSAHQRKDNGCMINIAICEDEEITQKQLFNTVSSYMEKKGISVHIYLFKTGEELLQSFQEMKYTFLFLDVDLGKGINGIRTAKTIRKEYNKVPIVFITSYSEFQSFAFPIHTFDYILKPFNNQTIYTLLDELLFWIEDYNIESKIKIPFKTTTGLIYLYTDQILYLEYMNRKIQIVTSDRTYYMYQTIKDTYKRLKDFGFSCPHAAFIVNLYYVEMIEKGHKDIVLKNKKLIPISQLKLKSFKNDLIDYLKKQAQQNMTH